MLFNFLKKSGTSLHKPKSFWSTFKNAYLRRRNLKKFWLGLNKKNLPEELIKMTDLFIQSESYFWTSKFWRHCIINHFNYMTTLSEETDPLKLISRVDYSGLTFLDKFSVEESLKDETNLTKFKSELLKKYPDLSSKIHPDMSEVKSIEHNIALLALYEKVKNKDLFNNYNNINKEIYKKYNPFLKVGEKLITQQLLISLLEYGKIKSLAKNAKKPLKILELGAGYGRTANMILSLEPQAKYVISDLPPSLYFSLKNLREFFKDRKIKICVVVNSQKEMMEALDNNDILFVLPHQLNLFNKKVFDISISIGNLCEMEKSQIKNYMKIFENISKFLYFKVWEVSGLPYSFYQYYSVHKKKDYEIKENWKEHFKNKCLMPNNQFELGYEFKN